MSKLDLPYQHGLSIREISKVMGISTGLVHKSLRTYLPQGIDN